MATAIAVRARRITLVVILSKEILNEAILNKESIVPNKGS
jgi:hypothetical protein